MYPIMAKALAKIRLSAFLQNCTFLHKHQLHTNATKHSDLEYFLEYLKYFEVFLFSDLNL